MLEEVKKYTRNDELPKDPWGNAFFYSSSPYNPNCYFKDGYEIISFGHDRKRGGGDDISNCQPRGTTSFSSVHPE